MRGMAYTFGCMQVVVATALLAGCTDKNPLFQVDGGTDTGGGSTAQSAGETTAVTPTSEPTSAGPTSAGPASDAGTGGPASDGSSGAPGTSGSEGTGTPLTSGTGTVDSSSGGMVDTGGSESGVNDKCGDGTVDLDLGEECDEGANNGNGGVCSPVCTNNVCGDKYVGPGEQCDLGGQNGGGSKCREDCQLTVCGDGYIGGEEGCDSGPSNGKDVGLCSHDCTQIVEDKLFLCATQPKLGKLFDGMVAGLAGADSLCSTGCEGEYKAMLVGGGRVASAVPYTGEGRADWVLKPYTAYYRKGGPVVFVTGKEQLLGVIGGADAPLSSSIGVLAGPVWTGLKNDWTSAGNTCLGWSASDPNNFGNVGDGLATTNGKYINAGEKHCGNMATIYCAQQ